jgi:hypothetical protein
MFLFIFKIERLTNLKYIIFFRAKGHMTIINIAYINQYS